MLACLYGVELEVGQLLRAMWSTASCVAAAVRSSAAPAAAAAPQRGRFWSWPKPVVLAAPADASGLESSRDVLVGVVREVWLNNKIN